MNINAIEDPRPELFLTRTRGALLLFGVYERAVLRVPGDSAIVNYRTGTIHFCHRDYKTQETAMVAVFAFN